MNDLGDWLARIGLQHYTEVFETNRVDLQALPELGEGDFEKLGVTLEDRIRLARAIEELRREDRSPSRGDGSRENTLRAGTHLRPNAERRQITVFYCDLVDSTALSVQLDPEDLHELFWRYRDACQRTVERYGGFVRGYEGDGIMVYFGYPRAFEDDAERAVRAGIELIEALDALNAETTLPDGMSMRVRVGIATGEVVAGVLHDQQALLATDAAIGKPPNLAARLQTLAAPNSVVICPDTHSLVRGQFEYRDLGVHMLKGLDRPVQVWEVCGIRASVSRFEAASEGGLSVFVNRTEELDLLIRDWDRVGRGEGRAVCISGEPGIGKSRLAGEFMSRISAQPHHFVRYQFSPYHRNNALYPAVQYLERAAGFARDDSDEDKLAKLETLLAPLVVDIAHVVPLIASLLSVPTGNHYPPLQFSPQRQKVETLHALATQLVLFSREAPVVLLAEDLHWTDASTGELLEAIVEHARHARMLVLVTYRPDSAPTWLGSSHVTALTVNRLSGPGIHTLVHSVAAGREFPELLLGQIAERTDGIPLFVEELTSAVLESGMLMERDGRLELTDESPAFAIPSTLKDSLEARLDQLGPAKETAQIGAAIGREFSRDLLVAVSTQEEAEIDEALNKLMRANLVHRRGAAWPPRYVFKHALVQEAAYESLLKSRRQQLHARIARINVERFPDQAEAEPHLLAHHYIQAELPDSAVAYLLKAGRRALQRSAFTETIGYMSRALDLLRDIEDKNKRDRRELEVLIMLGAAHRIVSGFASSIVEDCFVRARVLCDRVGTSNEHVTVLRGLWMCHFTRGELAAARALAEQTIAVARDNDDRSALMLGSWMLGIILFWQGEFALAREELETALTLYEPTEQRSQLLSAQLNPGIATMGYLSWSLSILGFPNQALEQADATVARAKALGEPFTLAFALVFACCVRLTLNRGDDIRSMLDEVRTISEKHGFSHWKSVAQVLAGQFEIAAGRIKSGIALVEEACERLRAEGSTVNLPWSIAIAATAYAEMNRPRQALASLNEAITLAEKTSEHHWLAELYRMKGELLLAASIDNAAAAESSIRQAIVIAREQGAKLMELRAATTLVRITADTEASAGARRELDTLYRWFTEGLETADLRRAAQTLQSAR